MNENISPPGWTPGEQPIDLYNELSRLNNDLLTAHRELAKTHYELQLQREWLQVTLASIADGVIATDERGQIRFMNDVASSILGCPQSEVIGKPMDDVFCLVHEETRQPVPSPVAAVLRSDQPAYLDEGILLVRPDGREVPLDDSAAPIRDSAGRLLGVVMVFRDTTERRHAEHERQRLYAAAQEAIRTRDQFLSVAAHELRTPITAIQGYIDLLDNYPDPNDSLEPRIQRILRIIRDQAGRLNSLIGLLLDVTRVETGQLQIEHGLVNIIALITRLIEEMQPSFSDHLFRLTVPDERLWVEGDEARLQQALQNLIENAVKYSPRASEVLLQVTRDGDWLRLAITDYGIGIPNEALPHLFSRFYRASNTRRHGVKGLGIGLYVVKELISLHRGRIEVESQEGHGSTFTIHLPLVFPEDL